MTCKSCIFCITSLNNNKVYECKIKHKTFNKRLIHGWFCKYHTKESERIPDKACLKCDKLIKNEDGSVSCAKGYIIK